MRDWLVRRLWGPSWTADHATFEAFHGSRWAHRLARLFGKPLYELDRYLCFVLPHDWTTLGPSSFPDQWYCLRCHETRDVEQRGPRPTASQYERASEECARFNKVLPNGMVPVQSVYDALLRVQVEAAGESRAVLPITTGSANTTVTMSEVVWE